MAAQNVKWLKSGTEAKALWVAEKHKTFGAPPPGQVDNEETLATLPVWQRTSTVLGAKHVYPTGAAILMPSSVTEQELSRVHGWPKILKEIDWHKHGFVRAFLRTVLFWHHHSTSGRFNDALQRFERWGVNSLAAWHSAYTYKVPNPYYDAKKAKEEWNYSWPKTVDKPMAASRATFFRIKERLIAMGLIEAQSHFAINVNAEIKAKMIASGKMKGKPVPPQMITSLWIKPTDELSRIIFEPGYWETVSGKYAYVKTKKKPRGVHVQPKSAAASIVELSEAAKNETSDAPSVTN